MRPYKIINGISYPRLYTNKNQPKKVTSNLSDPESYYYDDSIRLATENISEFKGKPICVEHDIKASVGEISSAWKDADGKMRITARVFVDSDEGRRIYEEINTGRMKGLSVGYNVEMNSDGSIGKKKCHEISLCREPFFSGAEVSVCATGEQKYKTNRDEKILFSIMASETNSSATPGTGVAPVAPLDAANKDASELARAHDELLRKAESDAAELKALREQNVLYQKEKAESLARYAESRKPLLKEILDLQEQQYKEQNGDAAQLPSDYRSSIESAFLNPLGEQNAAVITASAITWKKARDEKLAMQAKMEALESKHNQLLNEQQLATAQVRASAERINNMTPTEPTRTIDVNAAKPSFSNLFVPVRVPSEAERNLMQLSGYSVPSVAVNAAAPTPIQLPVHKQMSFVPNSMRFQPGGASLFNFMLENKDKFATAPTYAVKASTTRSDD